MDIIEPTIKINHDNLPNNIDIIIIGGGLYGLQLAADLYSLGMSGILIVEAGDHVESKHIFQQYGGEKATSIWLDPVHNDSSFWQPWKSETPPHYAAWGGLRRKLGGRSLYWHGVCIRQEPWSLNNQWWPETVVHDLTESWEGGPSLYDLLEDEIDLWRKFAPEIKADDQSIFSAEVFHRIGYGDAEMVRGMVRHTMDNGKIRFAAYTPLELWINKSSNSNLPLIACNLYVHSVIIRDGCACGVRVKSQLNGEFHNIYANRVVLAAGTIENSRLAIQALTETNKNIKPILTGLSDHIVQGYYVKIPRGDIGIELLSLMQPGPLFLVDKNEHSRSNIFAQFTYASHEDISFESWAMGEQLPNERSQIKCDARGELPWTTSVTTILSNEDMDVIQEQKNDLQFLWDKFCMILGRDKSSKINFVEFANLENTLQNIALNPVQNVEYYTPISYVSHLGTVEHEGCTLAFGKVIDNNHQIIGVKNLYVTGPSTFPRLGAANPGLTSLALVRRLANKLTSR